MTAATRDTILLMTAALLLGCGIRDVELDADALGSGGKTNIAGVGNAANGNAGSPANVGGTTSTSSSPISTSGTGNRGLAGATGVTAPSPMKPVFGNAVTGALLKSANYSMILTVGEAPGNNQVMQSTNHQLYRGFVGASQ